MRTPTPHKPHLSPSAPPVIVTAITLVSEHFVFCTLSLSGQVSALCSRTDILESWWCSVIALRIATAVFGQESRCVSLTTFLHWGPKSLRGFAVTEVESVPQESPVGDRQANGAIESYSSDGRHDVRVVPCAPKVPHAPKENRSRTRPSGLRPADMRRRNTLLGAQLGAAGRSRGRAENEKVEEVHREWEKSTKCGGSPQ